MLDRASSALGRIRRSQTQAHGDARDRVGAILSSAKYAKAIQDRIVTIRNGRFVIPIKAEFAGALPSIVHDTSASGQTLFVEPLAALEANNRVRTLQIEEEREIQRILESLSREVGAHAAQVDADVEVLAQVDLLAAKAEVSVKTESIVPELSEDAVLAIERGRHPLLGERAVAQSLHVDDQTRLLVISGPNMGGKTVALKMAGLFLAMTYAGMQIPAAAACVGRFERVLADIGDEQSVVANASTFSAHLERMREVLDGAGGRTLAIVDEIGGGTEPTAGAALAIAILERLLHVGGACRRLHAFRGAQAFCAFNGRRRQCERAVRSAQLRADVRARRRDARTVAGISARAANGNRSSDRRARRNAARAARARL